jgi:hypothetical protein
MLKSTVATSQKYKAMQDYVASAPPASSQLLGTGIASIPGTGVVDIDARLYQDRTARMY